MGIFKEFTFEAAHRIANAGRGHELVSLHGPSGYAPHFVDLGDPVRAFPEPPDPRYPNEADGLPGPTSEQPACRASANLQPGLPELPQVVVPETSSTDALYRRR